MPLPLDWFTVPQQQALGIYARCLSQEELSRDGLLADRFGGVTMVVTGATKDLARKFGSGAVGERRPDVEINADQDKAAWEVRFVHVYARSSPFGS